MYFGRLKDISLCPSCVQVKCSTPLKACFGIFGERDGDGRREEGRNILTIKLGGRKSGSYFY